MLIKLIGVKRVFSKMLPCIFLTLSVAFFIQSELNAQEEGTEAQALDRLGRESPFDLIDLEKLKAWKEERDRIEEEREKEKEIERIALSKKRKIAKEAQGFGHSLFMVDVNEIPPGPISQNYVLSPHDKIILKTWGQLQLEYLLEVTDDYYINVPDIGRVYVSGVPLKEIKDRILRQMSTAYSSLIDADNPGLSSIYIDISLAEIRDIRFFVQGAVEIPGVYSLHPSLSNIIYAIAKAGGVNANASIRNIKIIKADRKVNIDFYNLLIKGDLILNEVMIDNNDVIFVPIKDKECTIKGEVKMPGTYELLEDNETDIDDFIKMVGGLKPTASLEKITILRTEFSKGERLIDVNLSKLRKEDNKFYLMNGDIITVFSMAETLIKKDIVTLEGNGVLQPAEYQYEEGMRISDLIRRAGGLRKNAYLELADLVRIDKKDYTTKEYLTISLEDVMKGDKNVDVQLEHLDKVIVYTYEEIQGAGKFVELRGHVKLPGKCTLYKGMRLYDLLFLKGGFRDKDFVKTTYLEEAHILRSKNNGKGRQMKLLTFNLGKVLAGDQKENYELESEDVIIIRENPGSKDISTVKIEGEVVLPGIYPLASERNTISSLIKAAGGLKPSAFVEGTKFLRLKNKNDSEKDSINRINKEKKSFKKGEEIIGTIIDDKNDDGYYRIIIDLKNAMSNPNSYQDVILENRDVITIPKFDSTIKVEGEVYYPIVLAFSEKMNTLKHYIDSAGGRTDNADLDAVLITYPNGTHGKYSNPRDRIKIVPGSSIYIPKKEIVSKNQELEDFAK